MGSHFATLTVYVNGPYTKNANKFSASETCLLAQQCVATAGFGGATVGTKWECCGLQIAR
jgi:hypothetical protein